MSERQPIQNKQILDKVNESLVEVKAISTIVNDLSVEVGKITKELELRPSMDKSEHNGILIEFSQHKESITKLENNQRWLVLTVMGIVIIAMMQLVIK